MHGRIHADFSSWQKRCFAKMLKSLKRKDRFNDLARRPGARSLFFNRLHI
jgi:hypothetical protein